MVPARCVNKVGMYSVHNRGGVKRRNCEYPANLDGAGGVEPKKTEVSLRLLSPVGSIATSAGGKSRPPSLFFGGKFLREK
jgi:hypothetical protein